MSVEILEGAACPSCGHDGFEALDGAGQAGRLRCTACGHIILRQDLTALERQTAARDEAEGRPEDSAAVPATGSGSGV